MISLWLIISSKRAGQRNAVIRKISGHAPGSKEFYRYVSWAQTYQDKETEKMFEKLEEKKMQVS